MKTLVVAPYGMSKEYAFEQWELSTRNYDRLVAINEEECIPVLENYNVPYVVFTTDGDTVYTKLFNDAWRALIGASDGYDHLLSIETDIICNCDILNLMEENYEGGFLIHGVPWRKAYGRAGRAAYETGCTLATRELWQRALEFAEGKNDKLYQIIGNHTFFDTDIIDLFEINHLCNGIDIRR
jgi:hypothetical protein